MGKLNQSLFAAASIVAISNAYSPGMAQSGANAGPTLAETADSAPNGDIVVTGSRAITNGAAAPTPLTVASITQLQSAAPGNLADAIVQLPVFSGSFRPSSTGANQSAAGAGANLLSLRTLGPSRTLVLIDGRRVAPTTIYGATDANLIPQSLISRVDIVTGGASAAYGSDAVAGVVNFALDSKFKGFKGSIQGGLSTHEGDAKSAKINLTYGTSLADDRLHIVLAGDYFHQDGIDANYHGRKWAEDGWGLNPIVSGSSQLVLVKDVRDGLNSYGGTISACQPTSAPCPLALMQFTPGGTLVPFVRGANAGNVVQTGGDGSKRRTNLLPSLDSKIVFGRSTMDATDNLTLFAEANYANEKSDYLGIIGATGVAQAAPITIFSDNAYLPTAVRDQMLANGITSFTMNMRTAEQYSTTVAAG